MSLVLDHIHQFPHCDQRVLHAPEDNCEYCNAHPEWQALRIAWGISFTGHSFTADGEPAMDERGKVLMPCPGELDRGMKSINGWHGNIAMTPEALKALDDFYEQRKKDIAEMFGEDPEEL